MRLHPRCDMRIHLLRGIVKAKAMVRKCVITQPRRRTNEPSSNRYLATSFPLQADRSEQLHQHTNHDIVASYCERHKTT